MVQAEAGHQAESAAIFVEARQTAAGIEDTSIRAFVLYNSALKQAAAGDIAGALQTARAWPGFYASYRPSALREIATMQAKAGDISGALQTAAGIGDAGDRVRALASIATTLANPGR